MKKISTVFVVDRDTGTATPEVRPENQWVVNGEGRATVKFDGTSCIVLGGKLHKRFDQKLNKKFDQMKKFKPEQFKALAVSPDMFRVLPEGAVPCQESYDPVSFHFPHWVPVSESDPADARHIRALQNFKGELKKGQTYELVGPGIDKNHYELTEETLLEHASVELEVKDRSFEGLHAFITGLNEEGLVFHHPDGRMAKLRRKDFAINNERDWSWKNAAPSEFIPVPSKTQKLKM